MNKNLNFVFSDSKYANGYDRNEFNRSCIYNWISANKPSLSITTDYQIKEDHNNIFVLECQNHLRDFWNDSAGFKITRLERQWLQDFLGDESPGIYFDFPEEFKNLIKTNQVKILVSCLPEATPHLDRFEDEVVDFCKLNSIPLKALIFVDSNKAIENCNKINSYYVPHFIYDNGFSAKEILAGISEKNDLKYIPTLPTDSDAKKRLDREYYFISFNRSNWRKHRLLLGCYFIEKNDDRILWSYLSKPEGLHGHDDPTKKQRKLISDNVENLKSIIPKQIDTQNRKNLQNFSTGENFDKERLSLNCYFDIVTETSFEDTDKVFFTEKIVRPIVNLHPFIVISSGGFLKELKTLGFKTYDGLFDESYDEISDKWERFDFIINEIDRILSKSQEEIKDLYQKYLEVCIYNRNHLFENISISKGCEFDELFNVKITGEFDE
jgi:hypothetical protein|tara:strand:+ start:807 stop:2120 length:1314 start_codon:yes stop_codon:yes gene_type:complete